MTQVDPDHAAEAHHRISVTDPYGQEREGFVLRLARWDEEAAAALSRIGGDFRIVILEQPPASRERVPRSTVLCAPERQLADTAMVREAAVEYLTAAPSGPQPLRPNEARMLARGSLLAPAELRITPEKAFGGPRPLFDLLARELLLAEALADTFGALAIALTAPEVAKPSQPGELLALLRELLPRVQTAAAQLGGEPPPEAADALERASRLCVEDSPESLLVALRQVYSGKAAMAEDVYLLRALADRPLEALEVLAARSFVSSALVPPGDTDLTLDRAIAMEQLQFAGLVPEPRRLDTARTAFAHFRNGYQKRYRERHRAYWERVAGLHARLLAEGEKVEALQRLNTLTELGPPVGEGALRAYRELLQETTSCAAGLIPEDATLDGAVCPACALSMGQEPDQERVSETLERIGRGIQRQMARLSSVAVRELLARSGDARVERFLKVVQAAQLASLVQILDDELVGYLRRFLVEARIGSVLDPILARLQQGSAPVEEEAREAMREMARLLQRAFRGSGRALPSGDLVKARGEGQKRRR